MDSTEYAGQGSAAMVRDLDAMAQKEYDLVVVGGGITGACVARDAALRGLKVALVDKGDFASATTAASSKLIHGGLRYLQNLELGIVRESLRERRVWSNVAPNLIDPITFLMPLTRRKIRDRLMKAIGLTLYDWLAYDRNRLDDPNKAIPSHKKLSRKEAIELEPGLASEDLRGAMIFYDYQMYSPERLALACVLSAVEHGADVANYAEVTEFLREQDAITGVTVVDKTPGGEEKTAAIRGRLVVNATGPWADIMMASLHPDKGPARRLLRSKGIHLLTRALTFGHAVAVAGDATHFFILPWRGHSILGTTDQLFKDDPDRVHVSEKDIVDFLTTVNRGFPGAKLRRSDVLYFYAGLRPIVDTEGRDKAKDADAPEEEDQDTYAASRAAEVYDHEEEEGIAGIITVIGGKWTTSRSLAEHVVDLAVVKLGNVPGPCSTETTPVYGGDVGQFDDFLKKVIAAHTELPPEVVENLAKNYGSRVADVINLTKENVRLSARLSDRFPDIAAQVVHAARNEMALTVEDVIFRRTGLGTIGSPGKEAVETVASIMAEELKWDDDERAAQVSRAVARFTSWARTRVVVNPHSLGDRTGVEWPEIERKLSNAIGPVESVFTDSPMAAKRLTAEALQDGMEQVIALGGDGTINEVVNGFFENGEPINPEAMLAILTSGTGEDFRRTFGLSVDINEQIERLAVSEIRCIDLGRLTYVDANGGEQVRYFDNVASFGLSGATDQAVNRLTWGKRFGGTFAFQWGMFKALLTYRNQQVRLQVDDAFDEIVNVTTVAVCNGRFFGSGMMIAPNAEPDDGLFDVIIVENASKFELLRSIRTIYRGEHLSNPHVRHLTGRRIIATPVDRAQPVYLDVDGETPGRLPARFEILPRALYFRC